MTIRERKLLRFLLAGILASVVAACGDSGPTGPRNGSIRVETTSIGEDLDPDGYTVAVDQANTTPIGLFDHLFFNDLDLGSHQVILAGMTENCTTASGNPQSIDVVGGDTVTVAFEISCEIIPPGDGGGGGQNVIGNRVDHSSP